MESSSMPCRRSASQRGRLLAAAAEPTRSLNARQRPGRLRESSASCLLAHSAWALRRSGSGRRGSRRSDRHRGRGWRLRRLYLGLACWPQP